DVVRGERRLEDVVVDGPAGIRIIPAARGVEELTRLGADEQLRLLAEIDGLEDSLDVLLVDTAAGISANVLYFTAAPAATLVGVTPEPAALTDAYALVKVLATRYGRREFLVAVNMAAGAADAEAAFRRLARVAERFLRVRLEYQGYVPYDDALPRAVRHQHPVVLAAPGSPASQALVALAGRIAGRPPGRPTGGVQFFFRRLVGEGGACSTPSSSTTPRRRRRSRPTRSSASAGRSSITSAPSTGCRAACGRRRASSRRCPTGSRARSAARRWRRRSRPSSACRSTPIRS